MVLRPCVQLNSNTGESPLFLVSKSPLLSKTKICIPDIADSSSALNLVLLGERATVSNASEYSFSIPEGIFSVQPARRVIAPKAAARLIVFFILQFISSFQAGNFRVQITSVDIARIQGAGIQV